MSDRHASIRDTAKPRRMAKHLVMYARNGRWGTCASCPRDGDGRELPELCEYTERYDHLLAIDSLAEQVRRDEDDARRPK